MKKFLALILMSASILHAMEERPCEEKTVNLAQQLWKILGRSGDPDLKFRTALKIIKPCVEPIKWAKLPEECRDYLLNLQKQLELALFRIITIPKHEITRDEKQTAYLIIKAGINLHQSLETDYYIRNIRNPFGRKLLKLTPTPCAKTKKRFIKFGFRVNNNRNENEISCRKYCKLLIKSGIAAFNHQNKKGETALIRAAWWSNPHINDGPGLKLAKLLIKAGADLNLQDSGGATALMHAIEQGGQKLIKLLIGARANLDIKSRSFFGNTALMLAVRVEFWPAIKMLIDAGANPDIQNDHGETVLFLAVRYNRVNITEFLLDQGADFHILNQNGLTALQLAKLQNSKLKIIKLLEDAQKKQAKKDEKESSCIIA